MGDRVTVGATPVAVSAAVCGDPAALSVMVTDAALTPAAVGLKITLMEQLAAAARVAVQVVV